jgi:hypothetical protein
MEENLMVRDYSTAQDSGDVSKGTVAGFRDLQAGVEF